MPTALEQSFEFCRRLTRREARNFYFSFVTLPRAKRDAMCAVYAWMRRLDDLADDAPSPQDARRAVETWRTATHTALGKGSGSDGFQFPSAEKAIETQDFRLLWPALAHTVNQYAIPIEHFDEISEGALMDQEIFRYATFKDLYRYCYRVASLVGLVSLRVFEYRDRQAEEKGELLGIAFQLTNILRDIREDAARGRIYIPQEDLQKYGVTEREILESRWSEGLHALLKSFAERAEGYYVEAQPVIDLVSDEARATLHIMNEIYHGILKEVKRHDYRVFEHRARLPTWKKMAIVLKHQLT